MISKLRTISTFELYFEKYMKPPQNNNVYHERSYIEKYRKSEINFIPIIRDHKLILIFDTRIILNVRSVFKILFWWWF